MPIDIKVLCRQIESDRTVILLGAGSSIPSGAFSGKQLAQRIAEQFKVELEDVTLTEVSTIVEKRYSRKELISYIRSILTNIQPTGGILNLPLYEWKGIYTTNYDTLIEQSYKKAGKDYILYKSNYDFQTYDTNTATKIFKLHGSIDEDVSDGKNSRIIITDSDYDLTEQYRELLNGHFNFQINTSHLLIIGHSLSDIDLRTSINEALKLKRNAGAPGKIFLLLNSREEDRAIAYEDRGIEVCFGNLDEFFSEMVHKLPERVLIHSTNSNPIDKVPALRPITIEIAHEITKNADVTKMYNGRTASYSDIHQEITFERDISGQIETYLLEENNFLAYLLGASGVGKSTAARQMVIKAQQRGLHCWEHKDEFIFSAEKWLDVAKDIYQRKETGILLIDNCHDHIREVSSLIDSLSRNSLKSLKVLLVSTKHQWNQRTKSPLIFSLGKGFELSQLSHNEINSLLDLIDRKPEIFKLVESKFRGFSRQERRRRLIERCGADMFVCLKNIFALDKLDDIILLEYAELGNAYQDIYRTVSAMEAAGVNVHRQLIIRTLGLNTQTISQTLDNLSDIIKEYTIDEKEGLYGWCGRHLVIAQTLTKYKYSNEDDIYQLFETIIDNLNPTYNLELRTIRELCSREYGIGRISTKEKQNYLLRKMISIAPSERVPRHRLIKNLIDDKEFEQAENEIRIFERELRTDAPVVRYKILLLTRRANETDGLMSEDRVAIINNAVTLNENGLEKFPDDKNLYQTFCEIGLMRLRLTGDWSIFDKAIISFRKAEERIMDPEMGRILSRFEATGQQIQQGKAA